MPDEYIERSDAILFMCTRCLFVDLCIPSDSCTAYKKMNEIPAADVAPVKHGQWKFDPLAGDWICSECDLHSMEHGRFCPNCGAKNKEG